MVDRRIPPHLAALARTRGIELEFTDALGMRRPADPDVLRRVLAALGLATESEREAHEALRRLRAHAARRSARAQAAKCVLPSQQSFGVMLNLYSVRGQRDRGFGDFAALRDCVTSAAGAGLDFVGMNPLHALRNTRADSSPYYPNSRLFRSELYLEVAAIPEAADPTVRRLEETTAARRRLAAARNATLLDYDALRLEQRRMLLAVFEVFSRAHPRSKRARAFAAYDATAGADLTEYATFVAAEEEFGRTRSNWPKGLAQRDPGALRAFRTSRKRTIDFHRFVQFELARQWLAIARLARDSGMRIGLYTDLAIGSAPDSADVWAHPEAFVSGFSLGAPPDDYAREGQVWNFPPLHPGLIERTGGRYFRSLLRAAMLGAGAVRIDHAIGLVRQYWVPNGEPGTNGVMVRMPTATLFPLIASESRRNRCVVVAEDLGTLPKQLPGLLERHDMLSSRVLLFSRDPRGAFVDPRRYPRRALSTFGTHDLPPLRGYVEGVDLALRRQLGSLNKKQHAAAMRGRRSDLSALAKCVHATAPRSDSASLGVESVHAALSRAPSAMIGFALDDLAHETAPINVPGVTSDRHPVWARRMSRTITEITIPAREALTKRRRSKS